MIDYRMSAHLAHSAGETADKVHDGNRKRGLSAPLMTGKIHTILDPQVNFNFNFVNKIHWKKQEVD